MSDHRAALAVVETVPPDSYIDEFAFATITRSVRESIAIKQELLGDAFVEALARLSAAVAAAVRAGGKVIFFGNGGSAADATHIAAEFVGRFVLERAPMPALSLSDNVSSVTAIGNDYSYDLTFARQMTAFGCEGDVAIALSTSGGSANVLSAMRVARKRGLFTGAFTGAKGKELAKLADIPLVFPSASTARIQEGICSTPTSCASSSSRSYSGRSQGRG